MAHVDGSITRGCGTRKAGGIYGEVELSENGTPFDMFLLDPPQESPVQVKAVGVQLIELEGVFHILDRVGTKHYEYTADFVEEARRFGISRRFPKTIDFSKITADSRLVLVHEKAFVSNMKELNLKQGYCFHKNKEHQNREDHCFYSLYDVLPDEKRIMPSFEYTPDDGGQVDISEVVFKEAIFGVFPLSRIVQVAGGEDQVPRIAKSELPVALVNQ